nr:hypothetical protein [Brevibacillus nitrificans]
MNRYTYVENNPLRFTDPTGNYKKGDELLSEETQNEINNIWARKYTEAKAKGDAHGMFFAEYAADSLRETWFNSLVQEVDSRVRAAIATETTDALMELPGLMRIGKASQGMYKDVKGHHIHAKSAFYGHVTYDPKKGFSISQEYMKENNYNHTDMTTMQRKLFDDLARSKRPNTLKEHSRIAVEALVAGNVPRNEARSLVAASLLNLRAQLVKYPTRIPWN